MLKNLVSPSWDIIFSILQGNTLAPYLFIICSNRLCHDEYLGQEEKLSFRIHQRRYSRIPADVINDMDFVDDLAAITEEMHQAQELLTRLKAEGAKVGLICKAKKT